MISPKGRDCCVATVAPTPASCSQSSRAHPLPPLLLFSCADTCCAAQHLLPHHATAKSYHSSHGRLVQKGAPRGLWLSQKSNSHAPAQTHQRHCCTQPQSTQSSHSSSGAGSSLPQARSISLLEGNTGSKWLTPSHTHTYTHTHSQVITLELCLHSTPQEAGHVGAQPPQISTCEPYASNTSRSLPMSASMRCVYNTTHGDGPRTHIGTNTTHGDGPRTHIGTACALFVVGDPPDERNRMRQSANCPSRCLT